MLEPCNNGELFDFLAETGPFREELARHYFKQFMKGLFHLHTKGIVHRDLKSENILFDDNFDLKIKDLGYAAEFKKYGDGLLQTQLGTPNFMAPEIHEGISYDGRSTDLFAAGIVLFLLVAAHPPFVTA